MKDPCSDDSNINLCEADFNWTERWALQHEIEQRVLIALAHAYPVQVVTSNTDPNIFLVRVFSVPKEESVVVFKKIMDIDLEMFPDEERCLLPSIKTPEVTEAFYAPYWRKKPTEVQQRTDHETNA